MPVPGFAKERTSIEISEMSREEAIVFATEWVKTIDPDEKDSMTYAFLSYVIHALKQEPCEYAIDRQAVLSMQYRIDDSATLSMRDVVNVDDIEDLPPVNPKKKTGQWIKIKPYPLQMHDYECSECGHETDDNTEKYCSECGCRILGVKE